MKDKILITIGVTAFLIVFVVGWIGYSYFEAESFERLTGRKVEIVDAMFLQLRVQEKPLLSLTLNLPEDKKTVSARTTYKNSLGSTSYEWTTKGNWRGREYRIIRVTAEGGDTFWYEVEYNRGGDWKSPDCNGVVSLDSVWDGFSPCNYSTKEEAKRAAILYKEGQGR